MYVDVYIYIYIYTHTYVYKTIQFAVDRNVHPAVVLETPTSNGGWKSKGHHQVVGIYIYIYIMRERYTHICMIYIYIHTYIYA